MPRKNPNSNCGPKLGGASWLVNILMCWESMRRGHREVLCPLPGLAPCVSSIWPLLICILHNETIMVRIMLLVSSMSRSSKLLKLRGPWEPQNVWLVFRSGVAPETCGWSLKWVQSCGGLRP